VKRGKKNVFVPEPKRKWPFKKTDGGPQPDGKNGRKNGDFPLEKRRCSTNIHCKPGGNTGNWVTPRVVFFLRKNDFPFGKAVLFGFLVFLVPQLPKNQNKSYGEKKGKPPPTTKRVAGKRPPGTGW